MRVEHQFYESQRFKSFFPKAWTEDKIDYLMMRTPKQNNNNQVIGGELIEEIKVGLPEDFDMLAELNA